MENDTILYYARVSTNHIDQLKSLKNQLFLFEHYKQHYSNSNNNIITESDVCSVGEGLCDKIKTIIINNSKKISIIVTHFDRLTRNVKDMKFLNEHVNNIYLIDENKLYNTKKDYAKLFKLANDANIELNQIKKRAIRTHFTKRPRDNQDQDLNILVDNAKKRCVEVSNLLFEKNNKRLQSDLSKAIIISQNISNISDLKKCSNIFKKYSGYSIFNEYYNSISNNELKNIQTYIKKKEIKDFIQSIFSKQHISANENFTNEFLKASINLGKKIMK